MYLFLTVLAALLYGSSGYFMKASEGISRLIPTLGFCSMIVLGGLFHTLALRENSLGKTYLIVMALEAVTTFLVAALFFGERPTLSKLATAGVILGGVAALRWLE
jgi:multidrug transporter EmrE-like cation transporter